MKKIYKYVSMLICIILLFLNIKIDSLADSEETAVIKQIEKYTSEYDENKIQEYIEKGDYVSVKKMIEQAQNGYQERWNYKGLITNDMYIAYQFKEYMTGDFFTKGWWANMVDNVAALFYNDELKEYLSCQSPGKNKYKEMLKNYIGQTKDELILVEYADNISSALCSIDEFYEVYNKRIESAVENLSKSKNVKEINKKIVEFLNKYTTIYSDSKKYAFKNNLSQSFKIAGTGFDYIETTVSGIMDIQYICAYKDTLDYYQDFLENIQHTKNEKGEYIAPKDLRNAAYELEQELKGDISDIVNVTINEIGATTMITGLDLAGYLNQPLISQILLGIDIGTWIGDSIFDMSSLVKGVSYVQGYAYLGEIYSVVLEEDKKEFLADQTYVNAQKFYKDYNILWNIRYQGEVAYLDMNDFSDSWDKNERKQLKKWTNYESKKNFCTETLEMIEGFRFEYPKVSENEKNVGNISLGKELNIFLSELYTNGIRHYDKKEHDIQCMMNFVKSYAYEYVETYEINIIDSEPYIAVEEVVAKEILEKYFNEAAPEKNMGDIFYKDGSYYFPYYDYGMMGMYLLVADVAEKTDNGFRVCFNVAYISDEPFEEAASLQEKIDEYYGYSFTQLMNDKYCEIEGSGIAVVELVNNRMVLKEFHILKNKFNSESICNHDVEFASSGDRMNLTGTLCYRDDGETIIKLDKTLCLYGDLENYSATEIGLGNLVEINNNWYDKKVTVTGEVYDKHTVYHYSDVMVNVEEIILIQ